MRWQKGAVLRHEEHQDYRYVLLKWLVNVGFLILIKFTDVLRKLNMIKMKPQLVTAAHSGSLCSVDFYDEDKAEEAGGSYDKG